MSRHRVHSLVLLAVLVPAVRGADPTLDLALTIDRHLNAKQQAVGVRAAPRADDAEILRRISLDLAGRIPAIEEVRAFLADPTPDKRTRLVAKLLKDPRHAEHFTNIWRALLIPEQSANFDVQQRSTGFDAWLRKQIEDNVAYDKFARELLTVPFGTERVRGGRRDMPARSEPTSPGDPSPAAFFLAKEAKPENLASSTARVFLGVRIECAQCHDDRQGQWTRQQFWAYAAFFAGLSRNQESVSGVREVFDKREMTIPGSSQVVEAEFLDGNLPQWKFNVGSRVTLAEWMTARDNPFFAKAAVNRLWAHFFGTGLVDPEDDLRPDNPASHPELLDELARQFVAHNFDVQFLIRAITATEAYQRTSAVDPTAPEQPNARLFAHMAVKRLTPEQLFDSLAQATGYREPQPARDPDVPVLPNRGGARGEFLALFAGGNASRTEVQLSIPQALVLMNGRFVNDAMQTKGASLVDIALKATKLDAKAGVRPTFLGTVANDPKLDTASRLEALFLATLSRRPTADETSKLVTYVEGSGDSKRALAGVYWALLNSAEFIVNH